MGTERLIDVVAILFVLTFYMVWSVKHQSKMAVSGDYRSFGFSYIGVANAVNLLISLIVGTLSAVALTTLFGVQTVGLLIILGLIIVLIV